MIFLKLPQFVESVRVFALLSVTLSDNFSEHYYSCETSSFEFERDCGPFKKGEHCILIHCQLKKDSKATADDISNELRDYFASILDVREVECHGHRISLEQAVSKLRPACQMVRGPHVFNDDSQPRVPANTSSDDDAAAATTITTTSTATTCASK